MMLLLASMAHLGYECMDGWMNTQPPTSENLSIVAEHHGSSDAHIVVVPPAMKMIHLTCHEINCETRLSLLEVCWLNSRAAQ